jgi:hypothetical protein
MEVVRAAVPAAGDRPARQAVGGEAAVVRIIVLLLLVWVALSVLGALIEGLFWLTVVGVVLFLATAAYGAIRQRARGPRA